MKNLRTPKIVTLSLLYSLIAIFISAFSLQADTYFPVMVNTTIIPKRAAAVSMTVGEASSLFTNQPNALDGCFDLAMDRLDDSRWFAIATCQFSRHHFGHRAGIVNDEDGLLTFQQIGIENRHFAESKTLVRIPSSMVAEKINGGWQIVTTLLNQERQEKGTISVGFLSEVEMYTPGYIFNFGTESAPIPVGQLELVRGVRDTEVSDYHTLFAAAGRGSLEVFDHSSGWHQILIPKVSVLDITTYKLITGRNQSGELTYLEQPWSTNLGVVNAWNAVNRNAFEPGINPATGQPWWLVWPGTYNSRSDKPDIFQGGVMHTMVGDEATYIACHSAGVWRWHDDLEEKEQPPKVDCQAAAKLGMAPVSTGSVDLSFQGTGAFSPGWFWHLLDNVAGHDYVGISSLNMEIHQMPVDLTVTLVEE